MNKNNSCYLILANNSSVGFFRLVSNEQDLNWSLDLQNNCFDKTDLLALTMPPFQPNIAIVALKRLLEILMHYKWLAKEWHWQKDDLQTFMRQPQLLSITGEREKKLSGERCQIFNF